MNFPFKQVFATFVALILIFSCSTPVKTITKAPTTAPTSVKPIGLADKPASDTSGTDKPKNKPKAYKDLITKDAKTSRGLFTVHKIDDKYYFEIPDSILGREIMTVTRYVKTATGAHYGGEQINRQVLRFEKGGVNKVFIRAVQYVNVSSDSTTPMYKAVINSNIDPIAQAFDIKATKKDTCTVIDVTDFFASDNAVLSMSNTEKTIYKLTGIQSDRSYVQSIKTFPINTEIKSVKTYGVTPPSPIPSPTPSPIPSVTLPGGVSAGAVTMEVNTSMVLLPKTPMKKRYFDPRIGYFATGYTVYDEQSQRTDDQTFAVHWRLEAKNAEDAAKQQRGELIEPAKPIIYYIDPATPVKWRAALIQGVNDWQVAFEQAGWKNAIRGEMFPENDTMSLEDARFSAIRYFASDIENAYGPNVSDPRSGEILESHIGWYHNVMKLLQKWYRTQTAAVDPRARKNKFDDELMQQLVRFVSSHEVGHTIGLRHNHGASHATPVEKLRDAKFMSEHGHTSSIMDYARFNYVAQPEDKVTDLYPRIGDYDKWAVEWAYKPIYNSKDIDEDKKILNKWYLTKAADNQRLWFLTEVHPYDPRTQSEDLGDNAMNASEYGIKNLQRIVPNLPEWTKEEAEDLDQLKESYDEVVGQFRRYLGHVTKYIGGIEETPKTYDQLGAVFQPTAANLQRDAVSFLNRQLFTTPMWLLDQKIISRIRPGEGVDFIRILQEGTLNSVFSEDRMQRLIETSSNNPNAYSIENLFSDMKSGIWAELPSRSKIDNYRRNLQKLYVERLINIINPPPPSRDAAPAGGRFLPSGITLMPAVSAKNSDIYSMVRGHLTELKNDISAAANSSSDKMTRYHLQDVLFRITKALDPK